MTVTLPLRTSNPNNGSQGWSKNAAYAKARARKAQRSTVMWHVWGAAELLPVTVTITRLAPSRGLDPHDGLGAALKGVIDGVADALGLKNDRDDRVQWVLAQERAKDYAVRIEIRRSES